MSCPGVVLPGFLCSFVLVSGSFLSISPSAKAQTRELPPVQARITQAVDESQRVMLFGNTHPLAVGQYDRGPAPLSMPASRLLLVLRRSAQQEAALQTYLQSLQDSASPNFRKWMTPEEFGARFGVSDADLATVQTWLRGQGFTISKVAGSRMAIEFSGNVGQVQTAFATSIHSYTVNGEQHWANAANPQIPAALAPVVAGLSELNDFAPRSQAIKGPMGTYNPATHRIEPEYTLGDTTNGYYVYLFPADAATIYDTPTSLNPAFSGTKYDGTGVTIGIAGDSNIDVTQNANYRATFGLPASATTVVVDGADPGENGDALEAYLDTQVSGGVAPGAKVVLYTAQNTSLDAGLYLAIMRALDDNQVDILNVSFGACEAAIGTSGNQFIYNIAEQAAAQGISVTVSTGDSGSAGCDDPNTQTSAQDGLAVNGLASTPFNIAVGGTDFDVLYSNFPTSFTQYVDVTNTLANHRSALKYIPEEPWNDSTLPNTSILQNVPLSVASNYQDSDNIVAGGGGVSSCATSTSGVCAGGYAFPTWQSGLGKDTTGRNLPDVSLLAGNGLYGAIWGLCTDLETYASGGPAPNCVPPATGSNFIVTGVGGTSAAAPAFAGMLALAEQKAGSRLGQADFVLYNLAKTKYASVFHDVTTGDNSVECVSGSPGCEAVSMVNTYYLSGYNAGTGYDEATGLGSVDASQMVTNWGSAGLTATDSSLTLNGGTAALNLTHGAAVTVKATVTGSGGTPGGDVALVDSIDPATLPNNDSIGFFTLAGGAATGTTNSLPGGSYNVSAHYGGSSTFAASDTNSIAVTVSPESSSTSLKVAGYYDPATGNAATTPYYGFIYLLDAQPYGNSASASKPNGAATGTITFKSGSTTLGTAPLTSDGIAELQTGIIPGGANSLKASFPGDASFQASTSNAVAFTVQPAVSSLTMSADQQVYNVGDPATITATFSSSAGNKVLDSDGVAPTGTVTFIADSSTQLGTAAVTGTAGTTTSLASASATFSTKGLIPGNHNITATYSGDGNYATSSSPNSVFIQVISAGTTMSFTPTSSSIKQNQPMQLTVNLSTSGSLPAPTGTLTVNVIKNTDLTSAWSSPPISISNGMATVTVPANALPQGEYTLAGYYAGDNYYGSTSTIGNLQVTGSGTVTPTLKLTLPDAPVNEVLPMQLMVSGSSGNPVPTGPVVFSGSNSASPLVNGSVSLTAYNAWQPGPNTVTVTYLGDSTYAAASVSGAFTEMGYGNLTISPWNPLLYVGDPLTVSISVTPVPNLPQPTGTITVSSDTYTSPATSLSSGSVSITIPANTFPVGNDTLNITYSGDPYYIGSGAGDVIYVTSTPPGFAITGNNLIVAAGATTGNASTITVTPSGGFTGAVTLTAAITAGPAGAIDQPTLSFGATTPVNISGTNAGTATMTVSTTAPTSSGCNASLKSEPKAPWLAGGGAALAMVLLFGIPARRRRWRRMLGGMALLMAIAGGVTACGGSSGSGGCTPTSVAGTTSGTYTATVTATAGTTTTTTTVTITVN